MVSTILYGKMCRGDYGSMDRGMWKCSCITDTILSTDSAMTEIIPRSAK